MATLADASADSPRVVHRLMRHSTLELTGRDTRPRAVDIEAGASILPSLKPEGARPDSVAATGTDGDVSHRLASKAIESSPRNACEIGAEGGRISDCLSHHFLTADPGSARKRADTGAVAGLGGDSSRKRSTLESKRFGGRRRGIADTVVITGEATRTPDLRIMRPPPLSSKPCIDKTLHPSTFSSLTASLTTGSRPAPPSVPVAASASWSSYPGESSGSRSTAPSMSTARGWKRSCKRDPPGGKKIV
jgi:hypothetical protein